MRKSIGQAPTAGEQTQQKPCRTSSDIGVEQENHTVGRGSTYDRKGLMDADWYYWSFCIEKYKFTLYFNYWNPRTMMR
jgi:hypothetical protein